jgi:drug/metabolite transporter (DMT)-like permease
LPVDDDRSYRFRLRLTIARRSHLVVAFAAVYIVWGSTYLAIRYAVDTIPPFLMAGGRFLISGSILYAWAKWRGAPKVTVAQWRDATLSGALMLCAGNGAVSWAEQRVPSGLAALLVAVVPLWMVLIDWARPAGPRPSARVMTGVVVGLLGLVVLVGPSTFAGHGAVDRISVIVLMVGALAWAAGSVFNRYGARPESAVMSTGIQMLGGGVVLIVVSGALGEPREFHVAQVSAASWAGWLYLVTFGSLVGFTAYIYLLKTVSPARVSTYAYVNPIVAVFLGWAFVGEAVTGQTLGAAAVILIGVGMITLGQTRKPDRTS